MREILFRGKTEKGEWVQGCYTETLRYNNLHWIWNGKNHFTVNPETIGQYTGLTDKNGTKIFEGDVVHCFGGEYAFGFWEHNNTFAFTNILDYVQMDELSESEFIEVIGNIHDNPELLKEREG